MCEKLRFTLFLLFICLGALFMSQGAGLKKKKKKKSSKCANLSKHGRERGSKPTLNIFFFP